MTESRDTSFRRNAIATTEASVLYDETDKYNLEIALNKVGGFGLFQCLAIFCIGFLRNAGVPLIYAFAYLVYPQKYECFDELRGEYIHCDAQEYICPALDAGESIDYRVDEQFVHYLSNWQ